MEKKSSVMFVMFLFLCSSMIPQIVPVTPVSPDAGKIKIEGYALFYGNVGYISVLANVSYEGRPLSGVIVRLNEAVITDRGGGEYRGALTPYPKLRIGDELVLSAQFPRTIPGSIRKPPFEGRVMLASIRVANIIEWVFPAPGEVIDLSAYPALIPLRWNFTGTPARTRLKIQDTASRADVFSAVVDSEEIRIPASTLHPGKAYRFSMDSLDPLEPFKLGKIAAAGSRVDLKFYDDFDFTTRGTLSPVTKTR